MTVRGHILNGTVVLDEPVELPDGTSVEVDVRALAGGDEGASIWDKLKKYSGSVKGLPPDMARNHDKLLHRHE